MLIKEINDIGEIAFYSYSLADTNCILGELENVNWSDITDKNLEENNDFYNRLLDIVDDRITNNKFPELEDNSEGKSHILLRVLRIRTSISQYRLLFLRDDVEKKVIQRVESAEKQFDSTISKISDTVAKTEKNLQSMSEKTAENIDRHLSDSEKEFEHKLTNEIGRAINKIEPQLMTTVLTLMGVFSAVITIIMSVVITSSSWLNNANSASAVIAFIVPNLVVVLSIVVLLGTVFARKQGEVVVISEGSWERPNIADKALKKARIINRLTSALISVFVLILIIFSVHEIKTVDKPHTRYILSRDMYNFVETEDGGTEGSITCIEFELNSMNYIFPYDEKYFHNGNLYFCEEHQALE